MRTNLIRIISCATFALGPLAGQESAHAAPVPTNGRNVAQSTARAGTTAVRPYKNDFLTVTLESASMRQDNGRVFAFVALGFENHSEREHFISYALLRGIGLMDSEGRTWNCIGVNGLQTTAAGYNNPASSAGRERYTRLTPGERQIVLVRFELQGRVEGKLAPALASLSMDLFRFEEGSKDNYQAFGVGLSGIPLGK